MCPPLYEHMALCSGSTSPWCFRQLGVKHKSGEGAPHQAAGGGGHRWTSPVAVKRGCVAGPVPAMCSAPGLPLHTEVFQYIDGSHTCITPGAGVAPPDPQD